MRYLLLILLFLGCESNTTSPEQEDVPIEVGDVDQRAIGIWVFRVAETSLTSTLEIKKDGFVFDNFERQVVGSSENQFFVKEGLLGYYEEDQPKVILEYQLLGTDTLLVDTFQVGDGVASEAGDLYLLLDE